MLNDCQWAVTFLFLGSVHPHYVCLVAQSRTTITTIKPKSKSNTTVGIPAKSC